jgi:hypothetical protein
VDDSAAGPRAGIAAFAGIPYAFTPSTYEPGWKPRGLLCDLRPVDPNTGLPMLADGVFRPRRAGDGFEVHWTSFGSPGLATDPALRSPFAEFLERLASGTATLAHWDAFIVAHYPDERVEDIRRGVVRLFEAWGPGFSLRDGMAAPNQTQLVEWATALRAAATET